MREGTMFGTMFGLGVAAVAIGVTVSRLVVGPVAEKGAEAPPAALEPPPAASPAAATPEPGPAPAARAQQPQAVLAPKAGRPTVIEPAPPTSARTEERSVRVPLSVPADKPVVLPPEREAPPPPAEAQIPAAPAEGSGPPIAVVRSGSASPAPPGAGGARIIQVDPAHDGR